MTSVVPSSTPASSSQLSTRAIPIEPKPRRGLTIKGPVKSATSPARQVRGIGSPVAEQNSANRCLSMHRSTASGVPDTTCTPFSAKRSSACTSTARSMSISGTITPTSSSVHSWMSAVHVVGVGDPRHREVGVGEAPRRGQRIAVANENPRRVVRSPRLRSGAERLDHAYPLAATGNEDMGAHGFSLGTGPAAAFWSKQLCTRSPASQSGSGAAHKNSMHQASRGPSTRLGHWFGVPADIAAQAIPLRRDCRPPWAGRAQLWPKSRRPRGTPQAVFPLHSPSSYARIGSLTRAARRAAGHDRRSRRRRSEVERQLHRLLRPDRGDRAVHVHAVLAARVEALDLPAGAFRLVELQRRVLAQAELAGAGREVADVADVVGQPARRGRCST